MDPDNTGAARHALGALYAAVPDHFPYAENVQVQTGYADDDAGLSIRQTICLFGCFSHFRWFCFCRPL